jgi:hypothetical protein
VLGFVIAEEDPDHGGVFMTLGETFRTLDLASIPRPEPRNARSASKSGVGTRIPGLQLRGPARGVCPSCRQGR